MPRFEMLRSGEARDAVSSDQACGLMMGVAVSIWASADYTSLDAPNSYAKFTDEQIASSTSYMIRA